MNTRKLNETWRVCRICLQVIDTGLDLFSENQESKDIIERIYLCFQIILNQETYLPDLMCLDCIKELNMANQFRLKCITFEERFTTLSMEFGRQQHGKRRLENKVRFDDTDTDIAQFKISEVAQEPDTQSEPEVSDNNIVFLDSKDLAEIDKYKCDICNKVLKTKVTLEKHIVSMHQKRKHVGKVTGSGVNRRYHCTKCSYSTPHSQTLVNHMRKHNGERPFHCHCGKTFTQSSSLAAHQKTHSDNTYYTCAICGKQFKHAYSMKTHSRVHESGTFPCSICNKNLKSRKSLQEHVHRHYNVRNYNCEECGATFVSCSDLLNHKKKHADVQTVECHLCSYKTYSKRSLSIHLKRHTGDKSYKCELCDITVYTSSDLRRHRRVHTREKPFSCPKCDQRFSHSSSLNKHVRNVHGIQYRWGDLKAIPSKQIGKHEVLSQ